MPLKESPEHFVQKASRIQRRQVECRFAARLELEHFFGEELERALAVEAQLACAEGVTRAVVLCAVLRSNSCLLITPSNFPKRAAALAFDRDAPSRRVAQRALARAASIKRAITLWESCRRVARGAGVALPAAPTASQAPKSREIQTTCARRNHFALSPF